MEEILVIIKGKIHQRFEEDGKIIYHYNGKKHREDDGPSYIEWNYKTFKWYKNGKCHRINGPATENSNGQREWFVNDKYHRLDGPAVENWLGIFGNNYWFKNGELHREDGPAIEDISLSNFGYYLEGEKYDKIIFDRIVNERYKSYNK